MRAPAIAIRPGRCGGSMRVAEKEKGRLAPAF
jgi:hypothetical protein